MYEFLRVVSFYACKAQILPETTARSPLLRVGAETRPCITSREMGSKIDIQGKALSLFFFSFVFPPFSLLLFMQEARLVQVCNVPFLWVVFSTVLVRSALLWAGQKRVGMC